MVLEKLREHRLYPYFWKTLLALVILAIVGYVLLLGYFTIGEEMMLDLQANQTSFRITNAEQAHVRVDVRTVGQLFCRTQCELSLLNVSSDRGIYREEFSTKSGELTTRSFTLAPGTKGEGQNVYSVSASCRNVQSFLCPTSSGERRKTALLVVNYGLPEEEAQIRPQLKRRIEEMLTILRDTDAALRWSAEYIAANPRLRAQPLLAQSARTQDYFAKEVLFLENTRHLWQQESYLVLSDIMADANVTNESMLATEQDALALKDALQGYAVMHNQLRDDLDSARAQLNMTLAQLAPVPPQLGRPLVNDTNTLVASYNADDFQYATMQTRVAGLRSRVEALRQTLETRNRTLTAAGNALLTEQAAACPDCAAHAARLSAVCAAMGSNLALLVALNRTANATVLPDSSNPSNSSPPSDMPSNSTNVTIANSTDASRTNATAVNATTDINRLIAAAQNFLGESCMGTDASPDPSPLRPLTIVMPNVTSAIVTTLTDHAPQCCVFGECRACCNTAGCSDDPATFPVVFVHGHSFNGLNSPEYSLGGYFSRIQDRLQGDGYLDAGVITPSNTLSEVGPGEWGLSGRPITVRVTYYYNFYRNEGQYTVITQKSESLETYAIRLKELTDIVKHNTGKRKVNIVAHSMGGLVVRRYLQMFGDDSVDKVILIATPNAGVIARSKSLCPIFGEGKECADMEADSVFLRKLNDPEAQPKNAEIVTITGHGCRIGGKDGDGVVAAQSVPLPGVKNYDLNGTCPDFFGTDLHTEMLNIDKYPFTYEIIRDELRK